MHVSVKVMPNLFMLESQSQHFCNILKALCRPAIFFRTFLIFIVHSHITKSANIFAGLGTFHNFKPEKNQKKSGDLLRGYN